MQLYLYKTRDSNRVLNKTLTNEAVLNINLKRDTDIVRPKIPLAKTGGLDLKTFNYAYIPDLNRYYFINNIESINNNVDVLLLEVDVLETYKADILASEMTYTATAGTGDNIITDANTGVNNNTKINSNITLVDVESIVLTTVGV